MNGQQSQPGPADRDCETLEKPGEIKNDLVSVIYSIGKETINVVPTPTLLAISIVPLCISTIFLTIEGPNPLPPPEFVRADG